MNKPTPTTAAHTLQDQLAQLRELERQRIIKESCERVLRDGEELHDRLDDKGSES